MSSTRSHETSKRPNYSMDTEGLDINDSEGQDDEYREDVDDDDYNDRKATEKDDDDIVEEEDDDEEGQPQHERKRPAVPYPQVSRRGRPPKRKNRALKDDDKLDGSESERSRSNSMVGGSSHLKRSHLSYPVDDDGNPLPVVNEEYDTPNDEEGETKITQDGDLLGGRKFLVRSFTLFEKGQQKFMLSTEPARAVGFRDSYLFFQYHPSLYKYIISQDLKNDLIERGVLPYSYRSRQIALVTARSVYKEFGSMVIENGKYITDDYYVARMREEGNVVEGALAREPNKKFGNRSMDGIEYYENGVNPAKNAAEFFEQRKAQNHHNASTTGTTNQTNSTNWLYQHAAACSRFNSDMLYDRVRVLLIDQQGLRDPYTNVLHIPSGTQSSKILGWYKKEDGKPLPDGAVIEHEVIIKDKDLAKPITGISDIPREIYEDLLEEDMIKAIEEQKAFERS